MGLRIFTLLCNIYLSSIYIFYKTEKPEHTHHWAQCHRKNTYQWVRGALWRGRRHQPAGGRAGKGWEGRQESEGFPVARPTEWLQRRWGQAVWALQTKGFCPVPGGPGGWGHRDRFVFGKMVLGAVQRRVRREKNVEPLVAESTSRPE